jgi:NodT family efflux transporter outer membrane factor (OMF) lipoprotein
MQNFSRSRGVSFANVSLTKRMAVALARYRRTGSALIALSVALPFTGCTMVGPDFVEPKAPIADKYVPVDDSDKLAKEDQTTEGTQDLTAWWTGFHDPVLNELIDTAYRQNLTLVSAGTRVLAARAELGIATGDMFPQTQQLGGGITNNRLSKADVLTTPIPTGDFWRASIGAELAWEIDFWGKFRRGIESADADYLASIATYDDVLVTLLSDVASTYIGIRTVEKQIELANANIVRQKKALSIAQDRFRDGATTRLDVYQAQNVLGSTLATVPQLRIQREEGIDVLRVLLGMAPQSLDGILAKTAGIPLAPASVNVGMPADLLRRRPDIRNAELRAAAQSAQIGVAKADLYPAFSLVGNVGLVAANAGSANLSDIFTHKAVTFSFGPTFQWNILNYGQITNNVRAQDAKLQSLMADYQNTVLKAQQEVQDGIATYVLSREQATYLRDSVTAATGALDLAFTQYREGLSDFTTVLTAEQALLQAENNLAVATGATSTGLVHVYRALGGGWELRSGKEFVPPDVNNQMRERTNWGDLLPVAAKVPAGVPQPSPVEKNGIHVPSPDW